MHEIELLNKFKKTTHMQNVNTYTLCAKQRENKGEQPDDAKGVHLKNICTRWVMYRTTTTSVPKLWSSVCEWVRDF